MNGLRFHGSRVRKEGMDRVCRPSLQTKEVPDPLVSPQRPRLLVTPRLEMVYRGTSSYLVGQLSQVPTTLPFDGSVEGGPGTRGCLPSAQRRPPAPVVPVQKTRPTDRWKQEEIFHRTPLQTDFSVFQVTLQTEGLDYTHRSRMGTCRLRSSPRWRSQ